MKRIVVLTLAFVLLLSFWHRGGAIKSEGPNAVRVYLPVVFRNYTPPEQIAFESDRDGNWEIYVMNADGTNQTRLTSPPAENGGHAWSPDGSKIAFTSKRDGNDEIYVMNADGTSQMRLTNNPAEDLGPSWSPDGSKIGFLS